MTLDQIEEVERQRRAGTFNPHAPPVPSLQQAAARTGMGFRQCERCRGAGYLSAELLASPKAMRVLAQACPDEPLPIRYERCPVCDGAGGFAVEPGR